MNSGVCTQVGRIMEQTYKESLTRNNPGFMEPHNLKGPVKENNNNEYKIR